MSPEKTDKHTQMSLTDEDIIQSLFYSNTVLVPAAIDPHGRYAPMLHALLCDYRALTSLTVFDPDKPVATYM